MAFVTLLTGTDAVQRFTPSVSLLAMAGSVDAKAEALGFVGERSSDFADDVPRPRTTPTPIVEPAEGVAAPKLSRNELKEPAADSGAAAAAASPPLAASGFTSGDVTDTGCGSVIGDMSNDAGWLLSPPGVAMVSLGVAEASAARRPPLRAGRGKLIGWRGTKRDDKR